MAEREIELLERLTRKFRTAKALIIAEEFARELGETVAEKMPRPERFITRTFDRKDVVIPKVFSPVDVNIRGKLKEFIVISPTNNFRIMVERDRRLEIDRSYSEMEEISPYLNTIDAFKTNNKYIVRISDFEWVDYFRIEIITPQTMRFNHIFARWEELIS
jgi:hypothetical protein